MASAYLNHIIDTCDSGDDSLFEMCGSHATAMKCKTIHVSLAVQFLLSAFGRSLSLRTKVGLAIQADYTILIQQTMDQLSEFGIAHGDALRDKIVQYLQQGALSVKLPEQCFNKSS